MVSSGFKFQRAALCAVAIMALLLPASEGAQPLDFAGTMPEDYLPELKAILTTAYQRSPQVMAAEFERVVTEARVGVAKAGRLPSVGGSFSFAMNQTAISGDQNSQTRDNGFFYNLSASQALFQWGAIKNSVDSARINLLVAQKSYTVAARELGVILRRSYLALVVEKARLRQAAEALRIMRDDISVLAERRERGAVSSAALEGEKLRMREVQLEYNRAAAEFEANRSRFARLAGLPELPEARVADQIPRPAYSPDLAAATTATLLRNGAKSTLEYEIYDLRVRDATLRHQIEKVRLYPKIYAGAGFSLENSTTVVLNRVNQQAVQRASASIYAQWNIFDGFATRGVVREALAAKQLQERRMAVDLEGIMQNAQILERSLKLDVEQLELVEIRQTLAVEVRRRAAEEVALGNQPKGDVERAQIGILQAEARTQESRAAFLGRWSEFVALAASDPLLTNPPSRNDREKK